MGAPLRPLSACGPVVMARLDPKNLVIAALLAAFCWLVLDRSAAARPDGGGGDADRGLIAVTGTYGSGASALYLLDTRTRHLAVYRLENGRALEFIAARDCSHDFLLDTYNDESPPSMLPAALRKSWGEFSRPTKSGLEPPPAKQGSDPRPAEPGSDLRPAQPGSDHRPAQPGSENIPGPENPPPGETTVPTPPPGGKKGEAAPEGGR